MIRPFKILLKCLITSSISKMKIKNVFESKNKHNKISSMLKSQERKKKRGSASPKLVKTLLLDIG